MKNTLIILIFFLINAPLFAQPGPGPLTGPPTPIDGGLSVLLAGGAILGIKKYKDKKDNSRV